MTDRVRLSSSVFTAGRAAAWAGALFVAGLATSAMAASAPNTKLVHCRDQSCLRISGHRDNPAAAVSINGHEVAVEGGHGWRVRLPVETVREWSLPYARTIEVTTQDPETQRRTTAEARLPIGLLGHVTNLASLVVSIR